MAEAVQRRFGVSARGLWLTERVWEPELAADLATAGVDYALVDDRHFLATGFAPDRLHAPLWTESDGKRVALFPIDERLRYLIPFRPPEESAAVLPRAPRRGASARRAGRRRGEVRRLAGDQELGVRAGMARPIHQHDMGPDNGGEVRLSRLDDALAEVPSNGIAYLPTASYREMEAWSLPAPAALRLARLERDLGEARMAGPDGALVRGAHWRNFLVKYPESNRMHKKMQALSALCRRRGRPAGGSPRDRTGAVQRRVLARGVRRALPAPPARGNLAAARPGRSGATARQGTRVRGAGLRRRRTRRALGPLRRLLRGRGTRPRRRAGGLHRIRQRGEPCQRADPATGELPRAGARAGRGPPGPRRRRHRRASTTSRRGSASMRGHRSTPRTARSWWSESCRVDSGSSSMPGETARGW